MTRRFHPEKNIMVNEMKQALNKRLHMKLTQKSEDVADEDHKQCRSAAGGSLSALIQNTFPDAQCPLLFIQADKKRCKLFLSLCKSDTRFLLSGLCFEHRAGDC